MKQLKQILMKTLIATIIFFTSILSTGCKKLLKDDGQYEVRFAINTMTIEKPATKSTKSLKFINAFAIDPTEVTHIRIGIDGTHEIPLIERTLSYNISQGVTDPIKLSTGDHNLTNMELLKEVTPGTYEVLYSAVATGAPLSQYVTTTLPLSFHIPLLNQVPVSVDVVAIDEWTPEQFGWAVFNIGFTTVYPLYFYGATDQGAPSVMTMTVIKGGNVVSNSETTAEGFTKVYFPDNYNQSDATEMITLNLVKDGLPYTQTQSVETLKALPKEVILLNVYGSGMGGFTLATVQRTFTINYRSDLGVNADAAKVELLDMSSNVIWTSGAYGGGPYVIPYLDNMQIDNNTETYIIRFTRQYNDNQSTSAVTSVAHMIATPTVTFYWLLSGDIITPW